MSVGVATHGWWCGSRTYPTRCRYCREQVFYFTCNCGSGVFFSELGWPWKQHRCLGYLEATYGREFVERGMGLQMMEAASISGRQISQKYARKVEKSIQNGPPTHRIIRREPHGRSNVSDLGIVRELHPRIDVSKKLGVSPHSPMGAAFLGPLAEREMGQMTIHVGDPSHEDVRSYTFFAPRQDLEAFKKGEVVVFALRVVTPPGRKPLWIADLLRPPDQ